MGAITLEEAKARLNGLAAQAKNQMENARDKVRKAAAAGSMDEVDSYFREFLCTRSIYQTLDYATQLLEKVNDETIVQVVENGN